MAVTPLKLSVPLNMGQHPIYNLRIENRSDDPAVLVDGSVWYNTTDKVLKRVEDGAIVPFITAEDAAKFDLFEAAISANEAATLAAQQEIDSITDDDILSKHEKPSIVSQYNLIIAEEESISDTADTYGITVEKTAYNDAVDALTDYLVLLDPAYDNYTLDTVIDGAEFRTFFNNVYLARQTLFNKISDETHIILEEATDIAEDAKATAEQAAIDAANALAGIGVIADDGILTRAEKPTIVKEYNILVNERAGIDAQADGYSITTEKTNYDNAVLALIAYITGLSPAYDDYSQDTTIVRATFNSTFELVYSTRQILFNKIYEVAYELADDAAIIARSKGKHFIAEPTTPYYVGDLYSNTVDLYRCIVQRLTGAYNAADWEVATHYDRTKTIIDGGLITTGRVEVGGGILGAGNAGINGSVSGTPTTDIRFWAGADYANRATAPFRVQNDGTFFATLGNIGGWIVDSDSMYCGTKVTGNGFSANAGSVTIKSDGSIHAYKFYINANGDVSFKASGAQISTTPVDGGDLDGAVSTIVPFEAVVNDVVEIELVAGTSGSVDIIIDGSTRTASWTSSLEDTAADFVASYGTLGVGYANVSITNSGAKLIFTRTNGSMGTITTTNNGITPSSPNRTSTYFAGVKQKDRVIITGTGGMCTVSSNGASEIVRYNFSSVEADALTNSVIDFVVNHAAEFALHDIYLTSYLNEIYLECNTPGIAISPATASNNIPIDTLGGLKMVGNELFEPSEDSDEGSILINMRGYDGGTSHFRNIYIGDGKGNTIMKIDGSTGQITATVPDAAAPGTFHTGYIYYDGGTLKMS